MSVETPRETTDDGTTVDPVLEASEGSFPASDPPAWTGAVGAPTQADGVDDSGLYPVERRVREMLADGHSMDEIATALNRSTAHVRRIIGWSALDRERRRRRYPEALRRRVLDMRDAGLPHHVIARKFVKTPRFIKQVEGLARVVGEQSARGYQRGMNLLKSAADEARHAIARRQIDAAREPEHTEEPTAKGT